MELAAALILFIAMALIWVLMPSDGGDNALDGVEFESPKQQAA